MVFLVIGEGIDGGMLVPPQQAGQALEQQILPSLEMLCQWEAEGKIKGGVFPGERGGAFVMEASSPEEVGNLLASLPFWPIMKWQVKAMQSFPSCVERDRAGLERMKAATP